MARDPDDIAIERYRYLLRTAPPEEIERAHAEAFAALTPEQRRKLIEGLASAAPEEVAAAGDDPKRLARVATRAEMRDPGTLERVYGRMPAGGGFLGGLGFGGTFLSTLAGAFVGTAIAASLFNDVGYPPGDPAGDSTDDGSTGDGSSGDTDSGSGTEAEADSGGWDDGSGDAGDFGGGDVGDAGGFGGDIGGDIGGGDMGGGFDI